MGFYYCVQQNISLWFLVGRVWVMTYWINRKFFFTFKGYWPRENKLSIKEIPLVARSCKEDSRRNIDIGGGSPI